MSAPRALLVDGEGTALHLAEPAPEVYARIARAHGVAASEDAIALEL